MAPAAAAAPDLRVQGDNHNPHEAARPQTASNLSHTDQGPHQQKHTVLHLPAALNTSPELVVAQPRVKLASSHNQNSNLFTKDCCTPAVVPDQSVQKESPQLVAVWGQVHGEPVPKRRQSCPTLKGSKPAIAPTHDYTACMQSHVRTTQTLHTPHTREGVCLAKPPTLWISRWVGDKCTHQPKTTCNELRPASQHQNCCIFYCRLPYSKTLRYCCCSML
jgi:hypothetical protein